MLRIVGHLDFDVILPSVFQSETEKLVKYETSCENVRHVRAQGELRFHLLEVP